MIFHLNTAYSREIGIGLEGWSDLVGTDKVFQLGWWIIRLDLGVKVFFAISGFILGLPFLRHLLFGAKIPKIKDYFYRRLTRLEPPFILTLVGFYLVHVFVLKESAQELFPNFSLGLIYSHVIAFGFPNPINPVTWSLETEAQFYLILPLFFLIVYKLPRKYGFWIFLSALALGSAYFRSYTLETGNGNFSNSIAAYFINFSTGLIFSFIYLKYPAYFQKVKSLTYDLIVLFALFGLFYFYKPQYLVGNNILFNLCLFFFFLGVFKGRVFNYIFTLPFFYLIGGMCYTIYLIHYAFFYFIVKFTFEFGLGMDYYMSFLIQILLAFPLVLLFSAIFYILVEKPCMDKDWPIKLKSYFQNKLSL